MWVNVCNTYKILVAQKSFLPLFLRKGNVDLKQWTGFEFAPVEAKIVVYQCDLPANRVPFFLTLVSEKMLPVTMNVRKKIGSKWITLQ